MESTDVFATKGTEYILVIGYLVGLAAFWRLLSRPRLAPASRAPRAAQEWFELPGELFYHPGHTWVAPEGADVVRVGMDEFALRLLGRSSRVRLPPVGRQLLAGEPGWALEAEGQTIPVLAPVQGEVLAVNDAVRESPGLPHRDAYDAGWLLKVKVRSARAGLKNLLSGRPARAWMEENLEKLWPAGSAELGAVMADGGVVVDGFARALEPERWAELAREFLLTNEPEIPKNREEVSLT